MWRTEEPSFELDDEAPSDPVVTAVVGTPDVPLRFMAEPSMDGNTLVLIGLHTFGDGMRPNSVGAADLRVVAGMVMERMGFDGIAVEGAVRTTGAIDRVPSGSPAAFVLTPLPDRRSFNTISAAIELTRRGIPLLRAKRVMEQMLVEKAYVALPIVEDVETVVRLMESFGIRAALHGPPDVVNVKAIRDRTGLTQEEFALRFGLGLDTVQNWESGRHQPDRTARSFLQVIAREPERVEEALDGAQR